jgi:hypothetical protein
MNKITLLLLLLTVSAFSQERRLSAAKLDFFPAKADAFAGFDNFGYGYFIKDNVFIKTNGKERLEYRKAAAGKIARADIENPLLIMLFYENFNTVILLDNQLNEVKEINFNKVETPIVAHAAGIASQNRLWIYDSQTQQIGLYDYLKNTYQPITTPFKENVKYYQSDFNNFQWIDGKSALYVCDIFGKVSDLGKVPDFDQIQFVSGTAFFFSKGGKLYLQDLKNDTVYTISGIDNSFKKIYYAGQILSIFTSSGITNYKINLP